MKSKRTPILSATDFILIRNEIDNCILNIERKDFAVLLKYGGNKESLGKATKKTIEIKKALNKLTELYESQYK